MPIPFMRRLGICTFALTVSALTGQRATDTTSGFFGLNRRAIVLLDGLDPPGSPRRSVRGDPPLGVPSRGGDLGPVPGELHGLHGVG